MPAKITNIFNATELCSKGVRLGMVVHACYSAQAASGGSLWVQSPPGLDSVLEQTELKGRP